MTKRIALILATLALLAFIVGCSKAPEAEMQRANTAMEAAKTAEAETYAQGSYAAAMDTLNAANAAKQEQDSKFALFRSYGKSKEMYVKSEEMFNASASEAATEKEKVKQQVQTSLAEAKAVLDSAATALKKAPRGKGSKADIALIQSDLDNANTQYTDAETDFNNGKYMVAKGKVEAVIASAHKIMDEISTAATKKAGQ
jgi:hypothetical protein